MKCNCPLFKYCTGIYTGIHSMFLLCGVVFSVCNMRQLWVTPKNTGFQVMANPWVPDYFCDSFWNGRNVIIVEFFLQFRSSGFHYNSPWNHRMLTTLYLMSKWYNLSLDRWPSNHSSTASCWFLAASSALLCTVVVLIVHCYTIGSLFTSTDHC